MLYLIGGAIIGVVLFLNIANSGIHFDLIPSKMVNGSWALSGPPFYQHCNLNSRQSWTEQHVQSFLPCRGFCFDLAPIAAEHGYFWGIERSLDR